MAADLRLSVPLLAAAVVAMAARSQAFPAACSAPVLPERQWRAAAAAHRARVLELLQPGFAKEEERREERAGRRKGAAGLLPPSSSKRAAKRLSRASPPRERPFDDGFRRLNESHAGAFVRFSFP